MTLGVFELLLAVGKPCGHLIFAPTQQGVPDVEDETWLGRRAVSA